MTEVPIPVDAPDPAHASRPSRRTLLRGLAAFTALTWLPQPVGAAEPASSEPWADLGLTRIDGKPFEVEALKGKVVMVVNVASFCSYTPQYADLQNLWDTYKERGLVVLGVPCNQFGGQEPGSDKEIRNFCKSRYGVDFPLLSKQDVNGPGRSPLYRWLVDAGAEPRDVSWNFEKFVVNRRGEVVARFGSHVVPSDEAVTRTVEMALDGAL